MRHDDRITIRLRKPHGLDRLAERPDLVHLDEDRVAHAAVDPLLEPLGVRDKEVVADQLHAVAEQVGQGLPRVPVVLGRAVLDRDHGIAVDDLRPERRQVGTRLLTALEAVDTVGEHFARRRVEGDRDPLTMPRALGGLEDRLDRRLTRLEVGCEAALVADADGEAAVGEHLLQRVVDLRADSQAVGERLRADRHDHELLKVDRVGRVCAAVDHVEQRHRQGRRTVAAQVPEERHACLARSRLCRRERDAENRVRAEPPLVRRAVEVDQRTVEALLVARITSARCAGKLAVHIGDRVGDTLAAPGRAAVAQLHRLVHAGRCPRGNDRAPELARFEPHLDLDGRVTARVQHLPAAHLRDCAHSLSLALS